MDSTDLLLSGLLGAVIGALFVITGTLWAGRRLFIRESRMRLAQEIVPKFRESFRAEDWDAATEQISLLISSAWAVGIKDHMLIEELRLAAARLDEHVENGEPLDRTNDEVKEAISEVEGSIKKVQKRLHEAVLGRSLSTVRSRALKKRLTELRREYESDRRELSDDSSRN